MTCIVSPTRYASKKAFKAAVLDDITRVTIEDPSIVSPYYGTLANYLKMHGEAFITNHPKRSWFAHVTKSGDKVRVA